MSDAWQQNPGLILAAVFLFGIAVGLLLAVWIIHLMRWIEKYARTQSKEHKEAIALKMLEEAPIEIDEDRMLCADCWEERHPGYRWSFQRRTRCIQHLIQEQEFAQTAMTIYSKEYAFTS